jgi:HEAT repeat protein
MPLFGVPNIEKLKAKRDIAGLVKALNYYQKEPEMFRSGVAALVDLQATPAIEPLTSILADTTHPEVIRQITARGLGRLGTEGALQALVSMLDTPSVGVQKAVVAGLGNMADARAIAPLMALLKTPDSPLTSDVIQALASIATTLDAPTRQAHLLDPLEAMVQDDAAPQTRSQAIALLNAIEWQPDQSTLAAWYWIAQEQWDRCVEIGVPAVAPLVHVLGDAEKSRRQTAFLTLVKIGGTAAPALLDALSHQNGEVRQGVFWCLVKIGPPALPSLVQALTDERDVLRQAAARALGQIGDPDAVVPLIAAFKDTDWSVRRDAYQSIVKIGKAALPQLLTALNHNSEDIQWGAAGTLEALGWKPQRNEAGAIYWIVKGEWHHCIEIGAPAVAPLISRLSHWDANVRKEAVNALIRLGEVAVQPLIEMLKAEHPTVRKNAAYALGMIGDKRGEQPLMELLSDRDKEVGKAASDAISAIQTGEVWRG